MSALARRHGIAQGLLFTWRRQAREGRLSGADQAPMFVPVVTEPEPAPCLAALPIPSIAASERPRRPRSRLGLNDGSCVRLRPLHRNRVWSFDFVQGRTHDGRSLRVLTLIDEHSRVCLALRKSLLDREKNITEADRRHAYENACGNHRRLRRSRLRGRASRDTSG